MINPRELRLGNLILDETSNEITIDTFVEVCPNCAPFIDLNKCEPIPLTEECLVKFGFELKDIINKGYVIETNKFLKEFFYCSSDGRVVALYSELTTYKDFIIKKH